MCSVHDDSLYADLLNNNKLIEYCNNAFYYLYNIIVYSQYLLVPTLIIYFYSLILSI